MIIPLLLPVEGKALPALAFVLGLFGPLTLANHCTFALVAFARHSALA